MTRKSSQNACFKLCQEIMGKLELWRSFSTKPYVKHLRLGLKHHIHIWSRKVQKNQIPLYVAPVSSHSQVPNHDGMNDHFCTEMVDLPTLLGEFKNILNSIQISYQIGASIYQLLKSFTTTTIIIIEPLILYIK